MRIRTDRVGRTGRVADSRLTHEHDQHAITFCRRSERKLQLAKFWLAADKGLPLGDLVPAQLLLIGLIGSG